MLGKYWLNKWVNTDNSYIPEIVLQLISEQESLGILWIVSSIPLSSWTEIDLKLTQQKWSWLACVFSGAEYTIALNHVIKRMFSLLYDRYTGGFIETFPYVHILYPKPCHFYSKDGIWSSLMSAWVEFILLLLKIVGTTVITRPGTVAHICNPRYREAEIWRI
jgi:hypothetical protein